MKYTLQLANPKRQNSNVNFVKSFKVGKGKYNSLRISTGLSVPTACWDKSNNQLGEQLIEGFTPFERNQINQRLKDLEAYLAKAEASAQLDDAALGFDEVRSLVELWRDGQKEPDATEDRGPAQPDLIQYLEEFIPRATNLRSKFAREKERITEKTVQQYTQLLPLLKHFHYYTGVEMDLRNINVQWHNAFIQWGVEVERYGLQTLGKHIKSIKRLAYYARIEGLEVNAAILQDEDFDKPTAPADDTQYFTTEELERIQALDLSENPRLELERDRLIIGCYTGLRISDLKRLNKEMVRKNARGRERIYIKPEKVKKAREQRTIAIPILKPVKDVLERRGGFPRFTNEQAFNKAMKVIAEMAGMDETIHAGKQQKITVERVNKHGEAYEAEVTRKVDRECKKYELMSTHSCRRSFASNLYGMMPNQHIMAITGHKKEADFLLYIRVTADEHADKFEQFYEQEMERRGL